MLLLRPIADELEPPREILLAELTPKKEDRALSAVEEGEAKGLVEEFPRKLVPEAVIGGAFCEPMPLPLWDPPPAEARGEPPLEFADPAAPEPRGAAFEDGPFVLRDPVVEREVRAPAAAEEVDAAFPMADESGELPPIAGEMLLWLIRDELKYPVKSLEPLVVVGRLPPGGTSPPFEVEGPKMLD